VILFIYSEYRDGSPTGRSVAFRARDWDVAYGVFSEMVSNVPGRSSDWRLSH
jgi:hypothetical protein